MASRTRPAHRPVRKALIHAFVLFHLAAVAGWSFTSIDPATPLGKMIRGRLGRYMLPTGFWQAWNMFAPNPAMSNIYVEAEVALSDGGRAVWKFPRVDRMGYFERYRQERFRKWGNEWVWAAGKPDPRVAAAAARFAARQVEQPGNPARTVELVRYRAQIPSPKRPPFRPYDEAPSAWERQVFFTWNADAGTGATTGPSATQPGDGAAAPGGGER